MQLKQDVAVKLVPEPSNPVDAIAIAIKCELDDGLWHRIGYILREALDDVHEAQSSTLITHVEYKWVKFRFDFLRSGPGFYAGVNITQKGPWSNIVCSSASNF